VNMMIYDGQFKKLYWKLPSLSSLNSVSDLNPQSAGTIVTLWLDIVVIWL